MGNVLLKEYNLTHIRFLACQRLQILFLLTTFAQES